MDLGSRVSSQGIGRSNLGDDSGEMVRLWVWAGWRVWRGLAGLEGPLVDAKALQWGAGQPGAVRLSVSFGSEQRRPWIY
jgi:hypothetical protein